MEALANIVIAAVEVAEAEGRALRRGAVRVWTVVLLVLLTALVGLIGLIGLAVGLFLLLMSYVSTPLAAGISGLAMLLCAGGLGWIAYQLNHDRL